MKSGPFQGGRSSAAGIDDWFLRADACHTGGSTNPTTTQAARRLGGAPAIIMQCPDVTALCARASQRVASRRPDSRGDDIFGAEFGTALCGGALRLRARRCHRTNWRAVARRFFGGLGRVCSKLRAVGGDGGVRGALDHPAVAARALRRRSGRIRQRHRPERPQPGRLAGHSAARPQGD